MDKLNKVTDTKSSGHQMHKKEFFKPNFPNKLVFILVILILMLVFLMLW